MKQSRGHSRRRGGIYAESPPRRLSRTKGGIRDLAIEAEKNQEVAGLIRSKSITRQFRSRQKKKK